MHEEVDRFRFPLTRLAPAVAASGSSWVPVHAECPDTLVWALSVSSGWTSEPVCRSALIAGEHFASASPGELDGQAASFRFLPEALPTLADEV